MATSNFRLCQNLLRACCCTVALSLLVCASSRRGAAADGESDAVQTKSDTDKANAPTKPKNPAPLLSPEALAAQVKQIFRTRCFECHGGKSTQEGVKILDRDLLVNGKKKIV